MKALIFTAALLAGGTAIAQPRDARGIPVVSDPAQAPPGVNQPLPAGAQVVAPTTLQTIPPMPATEDYGPCTRERTDNCVQTYEGRARPARRARSRRARR